MWELFGANGMVNVVVFNDDNSKNEGIMNYLEHE
jgi:hypothetical protein